MLCIINPCTDPYFNLAAEEYLLKGFSQNCFMLYQNENSIIIGKHQNTLAEINLNYVRENSVKVVRRLSGGGTVFHDMGNLNFTFIRNGTGGQLVDFKKYTQPIVEVLAKLEIEAEFTGKNNLTIDGLKISGNAEHIYKERVLHHGTLLFSSELNNLNNAIKVTPQKYTSKAVQSIRSQVTNIQLHLKNSLDVLSFKNMIFEYILEKFSEAVPYSFTPTDIGKINDLVNEKYNSWQWNYGYSPAYRLERTIQINEITLSMAIEVKNGIIEKTEMKAPAGLTQFISQIESLLIGLRHNYEEIKFKIDQQNFDSLNKQIADQIALNLF